MIAVYFSVGLAILSGVVLLADVLLERRRAKLRKRAERGPWPE